MTCASASPAIAATTLCLTHQLPEDQPSSLGLLCPLCKEHIQRRPPAGRCLSFWESQPVHIAGESCSVFTLAWDDFQIRSLHPPEAGEVSDQKSAIRSQKSDAARRRIH